MTAEERQKSASNAAKERWANMTPAKKRAFAKKVARAQKARWARARKEGK